jgi:hypothetical protein
VDILCETLTKEQDPERMQRIQELIAVCLAASMRPIYSCVLGFIGTNEPNTRESHGIRGDCPSYHKGHTEARPCQEESLAVYDHVKAASNAWYVDPLV